jgi:Carboxypeptidase regulatory-like domain/TonB dependent receptor
MPTALRLRSLFVVVILCLLSGRPAFAQMETATLSGVVSDPKGAVVPDVEVTATRIETGSVVTTRTNGAGIYVFTSLMPGHYHLMISKPGFKEIAIKEFELYVQDKLEQNFSLEIGSVSESVTVNANDVHMNTTDAAVSTVVDRQFAENLPMNGRSFQTLIQLTPGVVTVPSNGNDGGQFSVNGQRGAANYWMVDGVSANIGVPAIFTQGNGISGALPSFSVQGGTNSLVSVDAMQEFRIQTSTYSPEFGRTPGGQISIVTRSGTNQFHGAVFEYLRNDVLDADDWFADKNGLSKPKERQNDFGGVLGGPIVKNRTFFFFSYEGLRLRLPQVVESLVPDLSARQNASPAAQPFLSAFPLPTPGAPDNVATGVAQFNTSFSNSSALDAYSLRVDHKLKDKLTLFGRYNYSPSTLNLRGSFGALSQVVPARITTETATAGATYVISTTVSNDFRLNYSRASSHSHGESDKFGGAVPLDSLPFPSPFTGQDGVLHYDINSLQSSLNVGPLGQNIQSQINATNNLSVQKGSHNLKFGFDLRRLSPSFDFGSYIQEVIFDDVLSAQNGNPSFTFVSSNRRGALLFHNLGVFAQDTWHMRPRLTLTYGLRWDVDFAPSARNGISLSAVTGFNLNDLSHLALALPGTPPFTTTYDNFAPRVGVAYQLSQSQKWQTVLRGGFGVFYDLATSEVGNSLHEGEYPFGALKFVFGGTFPLDPPTAAPPPITTAQLPSSTLLAFDPHLRLPYTPQWNVALEQALGSQQTISASYIGSVGRRLMQSAFVNAPNPDIGSAQLATNAATSDYNALQVQFQRRLSRGLQTLASYTWSHSIDTASAGSVFGNQANALVPSIDPSVNRGSSDFDIRRAFSAGLTYSIPAPKGNALANAFLGGWSLQNIVQARSAPPVDLFDSNFFQLFNSSANVRPDIVPGVPFYVFGPQYPGGRALNRSAFQDPPTDSNGNPLRQGNLGRNSLRAFRAAQWDLAVHRDFPIHEALKLQFRAEMFNVLNHPNFGPPVADFSNATQFGQSVQMLGRSLDNSNQGGGSFSPLYQIGGPRSIQLALKLEF